VFGSSGRCLCGNLEFNGRDGGIGALSRRGLVWSEMFCSVSRRGGLVMMNRAHSPLALMLSPQVLTVGAVLTSAISFFSSNAALWIFSLVALAVAVLIAGGTKGYPALLWVVGFFWLAVAGDLGAADLQGLSIADGLLGSYRDEAILYSLCAMIVLAFGMRIGVVLGQAVFGSPSAAYDLGPVTAGQRASFGQLLIFYALSVVFSDAVSVLAWSVPSLTQPLLAFTLVEYVLLFLVASAVFETGRGYAWLVAVIIVGMGSGMIGFWSNFKEPVFIVLIALVSISRRFNVIHWAIGIIAFAAVVWVSLVWIAIKDEYRADIITLPIGERAAWLFDNYTTGPTDYSITNTKLLERIGYTKLFSLVLEADNNGSLITDSHFYQNAVMHIIQPRVIFTDKPALNDSPITERLVQWKIGAGTSIGVGFVTQAYVDFGFPGLLIPLGFMGLMAGYVVQYFMTRRLPTVVCQALTVAVLFLNFRFETDIDKMLGGFVTDVIAMGLVAKFVFPVMLDWLQGAPIQNLERLP